MKILSFIEMKEGAPLSASLEIIGAAKSLGAEAEAVIIGNISEDAEKVAAEAGASKLYSVAAEETLTEDALADMIFRLASREAHDAVFLSASTLGKAITPVIAEKLSAGSVTDATALALEDGKIIATRPAYGGTVYEKRRIESEKAVINIRAGSFAKEEGASGARVEKTDLAPDAAAMKTILKEVIEETSKAVNLEEAKIIVTGGRGMESSFDLIDELAAAFGGAVGGTRPIIESGLLPRQQQVGQSGKIVNPEIYVAVGVSGAPQHIAGMSGSRYVIAINKDEDAPIFKQANVGIVGDAKKILPPLIEAVKAKRAEA